MLTLTGLNFTIYEIGDNEFANEIMIRLAVDDSDDNAEVYAKNAIHMQTFP